MNRTLQRLLSKRMILIAGFVTCLLTTRVFLILNPSPRQTSALVTDLSPPELVVPTNLRSAASTGEDHTYYSIPKDFRMQFGPNPRWSITRYSILPGDTLWKIAVKMETDVSNLATLNPGLVTDNLTPGAKIHVVSSFQGVIHRAKPDDDLVQVSTAYGLDPNLVAQVNGLPAPHRLEDGALLFLPGARPRLMLATRGEVSRRPTPVQIQPTVPGWVWPIIGGHYFSEFGERDGDFHRGLDIAVQTGTPAAAIYGGTVTLAGWYGGYGYSVIIDHGDGIESLYGHASEVLVAIGQTVGTGEQVILVGSTGNSTGPHLHLEVLINGEPVNPRDYLP